MPRCNGLGDVCREAGETCASATDCCNDVPCIRNEEGALVCMEIPDGGYACVESGGSCTINGDCCPGTTCIRATGSSDGTCGVLEPPPYDAYEPPVVCAEFGQICELDSDCCNEIPCSNGLCRFPDVN